MIYVALVKGTGFDTTGVKPEIDWVPLMEGVTIRVEPRINGIVAFAIKGVVLTVN